MTICTNSYRQGNRRDSGYTYTNRMKTSDCMSKLQCSQVVNTIHVGTTHTVLCFACVCCLLVGLDTFNHSSVAEPKCRVCLDKKTERETLHSFASQQV